MRTTERTAGGASVAGAYLRLVRPSAMLGAAGTALVGALLSGEFGRDAAMAAAAVAFAVAAANAFNDLIDVNADSVNQPLRPLPSQQVTIRGTWWAVAMASALALIVAFLLRPSLGGWVAASLAAGFAYSTHLKRILIIGNVTVAALFANALLFGAAATGDVATSAVVGAIEVGLFIFGREVLKGVPDVAGDQLEGVVTVATRWGWRAAVYAFLFAAGALLVAAAASFFFLKAPAAHLAGIAVAVVSPSVVLAGILLRRGPQRSVVVRVLDVSKLTWVSGLLSVALLAL